MARGIDTSTKGPSCHKKYAVCRVLGSYLFNLQPYLKSVLIMPIRAC